MKSSQYPDFAPSAQILLKDTNQLQKSSNKNWKLYNFAKSSKNQNDFTKKKISNIDSVFGIILASSSIWHFTSWNISKNVWQYLSFQWIALIFLGG